MNVKANYRPRILVSPVSQSAAHERPRLTSLIRELAEAAKSAIESEGATVVTFGGDSPEDVSLVVEQADGVVLLGGGDVDPEEYGVTERHPKLYNVDRATDQVDLEIVRLAIQHRVPVFAICRGMHIVNVAHGGTLIQHLEESSVAHRGSGHNPMVNHEVTLAKSSQIATILGRTTLMVQSGHHQAVDLVGPGLVTTARAADGAIEALESMNAEVPLLAVQWHPEDSHADAEDRARLFAWLTSEARQHRLSRHDETHHVETAPLHN